MTIASLYENILTASGVEYQPVSAADFEREANLTEELKIALEKAKSAISISTDSLPLSPPLTHSITPALTRSQIETSISPDSAVILTGATGFIGGPVLTQH